MNQTVSESEPFLMVLPTYRFSEACGTVDKYYNNFQRHGHQIPIIVFDDLRQNESNINSYAHEYFQHKSGIFYVGQNEKARFLNNLKSKLAGNDKLIDKIFRPSFGGNRNFTLVYTLGKKMMTVDDDMSPVGFFGSSEKIEKNIVCQGHYVHKNNEDYQRVEQDVAGAFLAVLGKKVGGLKYLQGQYVIDDSMDLYTNNSSGGLLNGIRLSIKPGKIEKDSLVKVAQTYRTGSTDVDAIDYINEFFVDPHAITINDLNEVFVISNFLPCLTKENWRIDSGVCALDNRFGLPPFIPTTLRFEDYLFRIWSQKEGIASAHVGAVQTHKRSPNRPSLASNFLSEELTAVLKRELRKLAKDIYATHIEFGQDLEITKEDICQMISRGRQIKDRAKKEAKIRIKESQYFFDLAKDMEKNFFDFDERIFEAKIRETLKAEFDLLLKTMETWPKILEASLALPKIIKNLSYGKINEN
ncbi:MAG: hypothetical protein Q8O59_02025 [bacterium]|nr:hypothetical protein [bacterium]